MSTCPRCQSEYAYQDQTQWICPECAHEWVEGEEVESSPQIKDANGNTLSEGDAVTLIKDLKVKGSSSVLKIGTKAKIQRFAEGDHDIDCRVDGAGAMMLKSKFVKKA
ncbi:MAG: zinc ribbon domain-containing protein YjdM [Litorivicinus sp.]